MGSFVYIVYKFWYAMLFKYSKPRFIDHERTRKQEYKTKQKLTKHLHILLLVCKLSTHKHLYWPSSKGVNPKKVIYFLV
jgi:hypothetical protein